MADCPYCDWRYDPYAACIAVRPLGQSMPLVWDGELRRARPADAPNGRHTAAGAHICTEHPMDPEVLRFGPLEEWAPIAEFNAMMAAWSRSPALLRWMGP